jgi:heterodisulfide reductase subunit B
VTPQKENAYELSTRKVAERFGIELLDLKGANCCGFFTEPVDHLTAALLAARDICLAEENNCDLVTLCPACFGHLTRVRLELLNDQKLRTSVNEALKEINREFKGSSEVKHFAKVLLKDIGIPKIRRTVVKSLNRLKVAPHYGCHIMKPSDEIRFDNPENPKLLDSLIEVTGAKCLDYIEKKLCCGAPIMGVDEKLSLRIAREKLKSVKKAGADAIVTLCPFCHLHLDLNQLTIQDEYSEEYNIPVLHYTQLLGLAQGFSPEDLGVYENRVPVDKILTLL